jgi:hypothetical protein
LSRKERDQSCSRDARTMIPRSTTSTHSASPPTLAPGGIDRKKTRAWSRDHTLLTDQSAKTDG